jgi:drug/metabolite transporter (DMT)-like permease
VVSDAAPGLARAKPYVMLVLAASVYGAIFSLSKLAAAEAMPPFVFAFWQSAGAGLALLVLAAATGSPPGVKRINLVAYFTIGSLVVGLPGALLTYAAPHLPAGVLTLVLSLSPPLNFVLSLLVRLDRFSWWKIAGLALGFAGVGVIVLPDAALPGADAGSWFLLALLAPVMFASCYVLAVVLRPPAETSMAMAAGVLLGGAVLPLAVLLVDGQGGALFALSPTGIGVVAGAIAVNAAFFILYLEIVRLSGPTFFAQFNYLAVPSGIAWGLLIFGEQYAGLVWLALALMLLGMAAGGVRGRK